MMRAVRLLAMASLFLFLVRPSVALEAVTDSACIKGEVAQTKGSGALPYNFRAIDGHLFAGGTLFNPQTWANDEGLVRRYLRDLRGRGVKTVVSLHVPLGNDTFIEALKRICREEGLRWMPCRMTADQVPDERRTAELLDAIDGGAYVHCQWGCDRTGAVIAKYLRARRGWSGQEAWKAVIGGGSHAGPIGGFKKKPPYALLVKWFWPEVASESREVSNIYGIKYIGGRQ